VEAVAVVVVGFALVFLWVVLYAYEQSQRRAANLEELASRPGVERVPQGFFSGKKVFAFEVEGERATLEFEAGDNAHTNLQVEWSPPGSLRLDPEGLMGSLRKVFGAQDIQVGDPPMDDAFVIQGDPEAWVREVLDAETRALLLGLQREFSRLKVDVNPAGVFVGMRGRDLSPDRERLNGFLEGARRLVRRLQATVGERVQVSVQEVIRAGKCPVCSDAAGDLSQRCPSCETAYHPECWDYLGRCAILGCGGGRPARRERQLDW